jgi:nitroimidazol reductase NimA-like FMN-containing flavoprotein (pyridoxamine 5'-phosphate oxidase superfamily)
MRRQEKEITDPEELKKVLRRASVCRLAMAVDGQPYVVPLNFGFADGCLFFHSAREGRKIEMLKNNPLVCFECEVDVNIVEGKTACTWGASYTSIIGFGRATLETDPEKKKRALNIIMDHYAGRSFDFSTRDVEKVTVIRVSIDEMTGKRSPV